MSENVPIRIFAKWSDRMNKRRRRKGRATRRRQAPARSLPQGLAEVQELIDEDRLVEAAEGLDELARRYPKEPEVFRLRSGVAAELHDPPRLMEAAQRWAEVAPDDPEAILNLAGACLNNVRPAMARRAFQRFLDRWPDHPQADEVHKTLTNLGESLRQVLAEIGLAEVEGAEEIALWHEEAQVAMEQGRYDEGISLEKRVLARVPNLASAFNNISLIRFIQGQLEEAIVTARRVLTECNPDNFHALSNLVHFLCAAGRPEEAHPFAERLKAVQSKWVDVWLKKAEGLSYLGDDEGVLEAFTQAKTAGMLRRPYVEPLICHLAGAAAARLGREREARRYFRQALRFQPGLSRAADNLADLRKPAGQRDGPWAFGLHEWAPSKTLEDMVALLEPATRGKPTDEGMERAARRFLAQHPETVGLIPILLERGDPHGRDFAQHLARIAGTPETLDALADFALSPYGPDELRREVAYALVDAGRLPRGQMVKMWVEGEQQELMLFGYAITPEPTEQLPRRAQKLMERAVSAINDRRLDEAEQRLQEALEILPDHPSLLQNLAVVYDLRGDAKRSRALVEQAVEMNPDYVIGRCQMARFAVERGDLEKAEQWLEPVMKRETFHISEFIAFCEARIDLELAYGRPEVAHSWLQMWEDIEPDHPHLPLWRRKVGPAGRSKGRLGRR